MSRILIAYASSHGQTREIAHALGARLEAGGHAVRLADAAVAVPDPRGFDGVVLGARVQFGRHAPPIELYVKGHRAALITMPTAFFSVSMSAAQHGAGADPNGYLEEFFAATAWRPSCAAAFGGALNYRSYGLVLRLIMRWLARRGGHSTDTTRDHVYTDWTAVARFADHVAAGLAPARPVTPPASAGSAA